MVKAGSGALTLGHPDSAGIPSAVASNTLVLDYNNLEQLEATFKEKGSQIAAIIVEPFPANCGLILPIAGYLERMRVLTAQYGSLLIFDEVMTGFRLAAGGARSCGHYARLNRNGEDYWWRLAGWRARWTQRDHGLSGPARACLSGGTLSGNPLAMAAGIAALKKLVTEDPYPKLEKMGQLIAQHLLEIAKVKGLPLQVPQVGSMFALFFSDLGTKLFRCDCESYRTLCRAL